MTGLHHLPSLNTPPLDNTERVKFLDPTYETTFQASQLACTRNIFSEDLLTEMQKSFLVPWLREKRKVEGKGAGREGSGSLFRDRSFPPPNMRHPGATNGQGPSTRAPPSTHYYCDVSLNLVPLLKETPWQVKTAAKVKEC